MAGTHCYICIPLMHSGGWGRGGGGHITSIVTTSLHIHSSFNKPSHHSMCIFLIRAMTHPRPPPNPPPDIRKHHSCNKTCTKPFSLCFFQTGIILHSKILPHVGNKETEAKLDIKVAGSRTQDALALAVSALPLSYDDHLPPTCLSRTTGSMCLE